MSGLLWSYEELGRFSSEAENFRLLVIPTGVHSTFRYVVLKLMSDSMTYLAIASGHCDTVDSAMLEAEKAMMRMRTVH